VRAVRNSVLMSRLECYCPATSADVHNFMRVQSNLRVDDYISNPKSEWLSNSLHHGSHHGPTNGIGVE